MSALLHEYALPTDGRKGVAVDTLAANWYPRDMALRVRQETTVSLQWIAKHLELGAPAPVAYLPYRQGQSVGTYENTLF